MSQDIRKIHQTVRLSNRRVLVYSLAMHDEPSGLHSGGKGKPHYSKRARFWYSLLTTIAQLAGLAAIAVWLLPALGVHLPWILFLVAGIVLAAYDAFTYVMGTRALEREPVLGQESMVGLHGVAVSDLVPGGTVRVDGELWQAKSVGGELVHGTKVEVLGREGMVLTVRRASGG